MIPYKMYILFLYKMSGKAPLGSFKGDENPYKRWDDLGVPETPTRRCLIILAMALRDVLPPFEPSTFATLAWPGGRGKGSHAPP